MKIAMIPARMGSQRLKHKNLQNINGIPLIAHAIRKTKQSKVFDQIWVNSEDLAFEEIALSEGVSFHRRPEALGNNQATHEDYIAEFLSKHECDLLFQVHTIAPLLGSDEVAKFVVHMVEGDYDVLISVVEEQIECCFKNAPVNFSFEKKQNSQNLEPVQRITWSITGWKSRTFLKAIEIGKCAAYYGKIGFFPIDRFSGHIIKTQEDLDIANSLFNVKFSSK